MNGGVGEFGTGDCGVADFGVADFGVADFAVRIEKEIGPDAGPWLVAVVRGDVDYTHCTELEAAIDHELARVTGPLHLVVDLTEVPYCDSCGMRVLLGAARQVAGTGGSFALRGVTGQPSRALRLTGLDRALGAVGDPSGADGSG